jgi:hypothetical protein
MLQVPTDPGVIEQARFCCTALWSVLALTRCVGLPANNSGIGGDLPCGGGDEVSQFDPKQTSGYFAPPGS